MKKLNVIFCFGRNNGFTKIREFQNRRYPSLLYFYFCQKINRFLSKLKPIFSPVIVSEYGICFMRIIE